MRLSTQQTNRLIWFAFFFSVFPYVTSKAVCESEERRLSIDLRLLAIVDENSPSNLNSNTNNHSKTENSLSDICKMFAISLAGDLVTVQVHHSFFLPMELKKMFFAEDVNFIPLHLKDALVNGNYLTKKCTWNR